MDTTYTEPGVMTDLGRHAAAAEALPGDFAGVARTLHGLFVHEAWADRYGLTLSDAERDTVNLRKASDLLDAVVARNDAPLSTPRAPQDRVPANCRGFATLATALLRAHGVAARARCGFGMYFTKGWGEDHWITEYFADGRWRRGDAQLDALQVAALGIGWDVTDLPEGEFLTGGEAWRRVRAGRAGGVKFGLSFIPEDGEYWIAGNLIRDLTSLGGRESLPWDCWDPMPGPVDAIDYAYFDRLAAGEEETKVPGEVFNLRRDRVEPFS